jgi:hypothetical protein
LFECETLQNSPKARGCKVKAAKNLVKIKGVVAVLAAVSLKFSKNDERVMAAAR